MNLYILFFFDTYVIVSFFCLRGRKNTISVLIKVLFPFSGPCERLKVTFTPNRMKARGWILCWSFIPRARALGLRLEVWIPRISRAYPENFTTDKEKEIGLVKSAGAETKKLLVGDAKKGVAMEESLAKSEQAPENFSDHSA